MIEAVHTLQEVAGILRLPYRTVRDAVFQGRWPHVKVSARKRLMTDADIQSALALLHQGADGPPATFDARAAKSNVLRLLDAA